MNWIQNTVYHLFPLGSTGAPERNDFVSAPSHRFRDAAQLVALPK